MVCVGGKEVPSLREEKVSRNETRILPEALKDTVTPTSCVRLIDPATVQHSQKNKQTNKKAQRNSGWLGCCYHKLAQG